MGKPLSDQIINHPAIHKTSNFPKKRSDPISGWLAGVSLAYLALTNLSSLLSNSFEREQLRLYPVNLSSKEFT